MSAHARIMDRAPLGTGFTRATLGALAVAHLVEAVATERLSFLTAAWAWSLLFLAAGLVSAAAALWFHTRVVVLAGALTLCAFAMRGGVVVVAYADGTRSGWEVVADLGVWWGIALYGWSVIFTRGAVPLVAAADRGE